MSRLACLGTLLVVSGAAAADVPLPKRPNVLFVLTDDQRWDTIRALGNSEIHTPTLDRLVQTGFYFNNAYCMGSMVGAVCLPSRTMIMTGRSLWHLPAIKGAQAPPDLVLLPRVLKAAGYVTYHCGKSGNACRYGNAEFATNITIDRRVPDTSKEYADLAIEFLGKYDGRQPFFMYLAPPVPHDPRVAPERFVKMYDPTKLTLSKNFMPQHPFDNGELKIRDEMLAAFPRTPDEMRRHLADYYAAISNWDHEMGRILDTLKDLGLTDQTIVVFSSDQGLAVGGRHGLMGKQNLYEHVKPPLIFAGPGIPHGRSEALVYLFDLFPTFCELTGAAPPEVVEGKSLVPVIRGDKPRVRETLFGAYRNCQRMIRDERWKLIKYNAGGIRNMQLFDLKDDPDELQNLAGNPRFAEQTRRLEGQLAEARRHFGDPIDFDAGGTLK